LSAAGWWSALSPGPRTGAACCATAPDGWTSRPPASHSRPSSPAFSWGSYAAAFCQGVALGAFAQGIRVEGQAYAGGWWDWLTPFSLLTGAALGLALADDLLLAGVAGEVDACGKYGDPTSRV